MHDSSASASSPARQPGLRRNLTVQVLLAITLGVLLGALRPEWGRAMKPLGDTFINLVKMVIGPIIFLTIVLGVANMQDVRKVGRVGGKAFLYFEVVSTFALAIGLAVVNVTRPGAGIDVAALSGGDVTRYTAAGGRRRASSASSPTSSRRASSAPSRTARSSRSSSSPSSSDSRCSAWGSRRGRCSRRSSGSRRCSSD